MATSLPVSLLSLALIAIQPGMLSAKIAFPPISELDRPHASALTIADTPDTARRHPLKGVIVDVRADKQSLLVKHEEIPGVMRAMTMLLKTDLATLQKAAKGQKITGLLVRKDDGWWIEAVAVLP